MKRKRILKILIPASLALMLAAGTRVQDALAYFTSYTAAAGRVQVSLSFTETETGDNVSDWTKHISVINTGTVPCFVRAKVLVSEKYEKYLSCSSRREGSWTLEEDGYWYYDTVLNPGETADELLTALDRVVLNQDTENGEQQEFNVIVVQEETRALYDGDGNPYADWTMTEKSAQPAGERAERVAAGDSANAEAGAGDAGSGESGAADAGSGDVEAGAGDAGSGESGAGTAGAGGAEVKDSTETEGNTGEGGR